MRQTAGTLNRIWLAILGILALAAGTGLLLQSNGTLHALLNTARLWESVVTGDLHAFFAQPWVAATLLILGVIMAVLGLLWIIAQIPRKNTARAYRLHDDGSQGFTLCDPSVLAAAVESRINALPGVVSSAVLLRGTGKAPDLSLRVTVNDRADVQDVIHRIQTSTLRELSSALEAPLQRSQLQIDISGRSQSTGTVVHSTGTVVY
ncbi:alkaline shock response membrane anchor protein AmaP [Arthrobacter sp. SO3]|uniref:alkaline shock response membrane anchor protein AmaP n=1 Tax=Arthrobacter sp. SO3 TaxID=1897057 RepID=UPI001CFF92C5|nr:alkaline shock response membrane anchor protein AmaP [Arthrobacter sp. SO3]MCB5292527.1 hypothetical protein [Arthrobacter sp. SO3]